MTSAPSGSTGLDRLDLGDEMAALLAQRLQRRALLALDQHAHRAVGQLQQLQHGGDDAEIVERLAVGIVLGRIELRDQEDALVRRHRAFQRGHRFVAADEQRHDHVREDDDVAQRQDGIGFAHWILHRPGMGPALGLYGARSDGINEGAVQTRLLSRCSAIDPLRDGRGFQELAPLESGSFPNVSCVLFLAAPLLLAPVGPARVTATARRGQSRTGENCDAAAERRRRRRRGSVLGGIVGGIGLGRVGGVGRRTSSRSARCSARRSSACSTAASSSRPRPRPRKRCAAATSAPPRPGRARPGPDVTGSSTVTAVEPRADGECMTVTDIVIVDGEETARPSGCAAGRRPTAMSASRPAAPPARVRCCGRRALLRADAAGAAQRAMDPNNPTCPPTRTGRPIARCASRCRRWTAARCCSPRA